MKYKKYYIGLKGEIEKKNQFRKKDQKNQKNEDQNWHKKSNQFFYWMVKLKRQITLTKWEKEWGSDW